MAANRYIDLRTRSFSSERLKRNDRRLEKELLAMNLQDLREFLGKTQEEIARIAEMSQGQLSVTERREDHLVSTLKRYVEALGGELEITAEFGNKRIRLHGV
jgi:hypothetical protein